MSTRFSTLFLGLAAAVFLVFAGTANAGSRPLDTGITVSDIGQPEQLAYHRIKDAGASMTRVIVFWSSVAPADEPESWDPANPGEPHYNWSDVDARIQMAVNAGLTPLVQIFSAPNWAERCKRQTPGICNPDISDFADFTKAAARRYNGNYEGLPRVRFWEPWNEPNLLLWFAPQYKNGKKVSPTLYRNMLNRFAGVVKGINPTNTVVAGGLAPLGGLGNLAPLDFARRVLCMKGRNNPKPKRGCRDRATFDIWAHNPYTTGGPAHAAAGKDDVSLGDLPRMAKLLKAAKAAGKIRTKRRSIQFWVTEFSWDSKPPDPGGVPMEILTRWTSEAMYRAWKAGVSKFFWFSLRDWPRSDGTPYRETIEAGLYFRGLSVAQDKPKRNLNAFRFPFVAFGGKRGVSIWGRTPTSTRGNVAVTYRAGGKWKQLTKVKADGDGIFKSFVKTRLARTLGKRKTASVRATYRGQSARPFSLRPVKDYYQPPFGL